MWRRGGGRGLATADITKQTGCVDVAPTFEPPVTNWGIHPPNHGHGYGQNWCTPIRFVPCQAAFSFMKYSYFEFYLGNPTSWPLVEGQVHIARPGSIQFTLFFYNHKWDTYISKLSLIIQRQSHGWGQRSVLDSSWPCIESSWLIVM